MKAKTVWGTVDDGVLYWKSLTGRIWFNDDADVRWVNCFGEDVSSRDMLALKGTGKILGDSDES